MNQHETKILDLKLINMNKYYFFSLIVFCLFVFSCKNNQNISFYHKDSSISKNFYRDIPLSKKGQPDPFFKILMNVRDKIKLPDRLENGYKTFAVRFWFTYSKINQEDVVCFKQVKNQWFAEFTNLEYLFDTATEINNLIITKSVKEPKNGWNFFLDSLLKLNITTIKDQSQTPEMFYNAGVSVVRVEVSNRNYYRFYGLQTPIHFSKEFPDAKNMAQIMELIKSEFDLSNLKFME